MELPLEAENDEPRLYYDVNHGRWVAAENSWVCLNGGEATFGYGSLDFAISDGPDPTKGWETYYYFYVDSRPPNRIGEQPDAFR